LPRGCNPASRQIGAEATLLPLRSPGAPAMRCPMLTFRIAMTATVMTFDHRDDQAVPPKIVTAEVNQITDLRWLPLPCSA
jgi:hypothetical protein